MNKQIYKIAGVTENDFKTWCKDTGRKAYKPVPQFCHWSDSRHGCPPARLARQQCHTGGTRLHGDPP